MIKESNRDYNRRFERTVAAMTVEEFQRWNPNVSAAQAEERIGKAKVFVSKLPHNPLQEEVDALIQAGAAQITMRVLSARLKAIGYKLDRSADCRSLSRWMTGPRAGKSHPCLSVYLRQIDDGKSAYNFEARRDDNFKQLQKMREDYFAISCGALVSF